MKNRLIAVASALWLALLSSGCGTLYNHEIGPCPKHVTDSYRVYGGVRKDLEAVAATDSMVSVPTAGLVLALDVPMCAVLDTALLPITIPASLNRAPEPLKTVEAWPRQQNGASTPQPSSNANR